MKAVGIEQYRLTFIQTIDKAYFVCFPNKIILNLLLSFASFFRQRHIMKRRFKVETIFKNDCRCQRITYSIQIFGNNPLYVFSTDFQTVNSFSSIAKKEKKRYACFDTGKQCSIDNI